MAEETYLRIVALKTAAHFAACGELGSVLAGTSEDRASALRDDTLDLTGKSGRLGKRVASDLEQGKMSLATLFALRSPGDIRGILLSNDPARARQLLHPTGALEYAMSRSREYAERAKAALSILPRSGARAELSRLADFAYVREQ